MGCVLFKEGYRLALSVTPIVKDNLGGANMVVASITFDSAYPTGGEPLTPASLGVSTIQALIPAPAGGYVFEYDYANKKLKAMIGDNNNTNDSPLVEEANDTNLSAVTCRVVVFGR